MTDVLATVGRNLTAGLLAITPPEKGEAAPPPEVRTDRLEALELVIEKGLSTFIEVGTALAEINEKRLYKVLGYTSWDTYCQERWSLSGRRANQQIAAADVVGKVGKIFPTSGVTESQARELAPLANEPEKAAAAYTAAVEATGGKPTAKAIAVEVAKVKAAPKAVEKPAAKPASPKTIAPRPGVTARPWREVVTQLDEFELALTEHGRPTAARIHTLEQRLGKLLLTLKGSK